MLALGDGCVMFVAWLSLEMIRARHSSDLLLGVAFAFGQAGVGVAVLAVHRLYRARVAAVPWAELRGLVRVVVATATSAWIFDRWWWPNHRLLPDAVAAGVSAFFVYCWRETYGQWLRTHREQGRYARVVVVVGQPAETKAVVDLLVSHPGLGYIPGAVYHEGPTESECPGDLQPSPCAELLHLIGQAQATGVILCASVLSTDTIGDTIDCLHASRVHVQLFSGPMGIAHGRIRPLPVAHEPLYYLEPRSATQLQELSKRALDLAGASVLLVLTLPVLVLAAVLIKLEDRGPVLFRQERIGRDGRPFTLIKLRTMVRNAETMVGGLAERNSRAGGPLFKVRGDPRVTRIGQLLRDTSLDELPQLVNVLRGEMSLVGPRPALASETKHFDDVLLRRLSLRPGLTGLWQVEAQDNPSFFAYRHLDLFYVRNWSFLMDLSILLASVKLVVLRLIGAAARVSRRSPKPVECRPASEWSWRQRPTVWVGQSSPHGRQTAGP
jgi:exopolysaccharide biosynthesis polyprenyl glycosylphosphotransferase